MIDLQIPRWLFATSSREIFLPSIVHHETVECCFEYSDWIFAPKKKTFHLVHWKRILKLGSLKLGHWRPNVFTDKAGRWFDFCENSPSSKTILFGNNSETCRNVSLWFSVLQSLRFLHDLTISRSITSSIADRSVQQGFNSKSKVASSVDALAAQQADRWAYYQRVQCSQATAKHCWSWTNEQSTTTKTFRLDI